MPLLGELTKSHFSLLPGLSDERGGWPGVGGHCSAVSGSSVNEVGSTRTASTARCRLATASGALAPTSQLWI